MREKITLNNILGTIRETEKSKSFNILAINLIQTGSDALLTPKFLMPYNPDYRTVKLPIRKKFPDIPRSNPDRINRR